MKSMKNGPIGKTSTGMASEGSIVLVAVPAAFAVTKPFDTTATEVLLLLQVTLLSVALLGLIVAVSLYLSPTLIVYDDGVTLIDVTATLGLVAITVHDAVLPFDVLTVITEVPSF